jgi:lipopolysaccharide transport system ATP-binding protein
MSSEVNKARLTLTEENLKEHTMPVNLADNIAIRVSNLSKCYHIYDKPRDRLLQMLARGRKQLYREFWALQDVSFEIKKGETVGIVGRNGSGKSTLLQLICGTLNPTSGTIQTNGRIAALLELGSGFNPEFTGRENVYMNAAVLGLAKEETDVRYDDIVAFADIGEFINQPVKTYSSGMMVRLAFAVQATVDPDILIVDEALAVGDEKFQRKCFARLEDLKSQGTSILFVSHAGPQVIELCDKALLLEQGTRLMYTSPMPVIRTYQELLYAPPGEHQRVIRKCYVADRLDKGDGKQNSQDPAEIISNVEDSFDPGLIPETTTIYPLNGAEIQKIHILNKQDRSVNVLHSNQNYYFVISGRFLTDIDRVYFGIHIRSISGVIITGQRYPEEGKYVNFVHAGDGFKISFNFKMVLLPGTYFVGGGIWSNQELGCQHRILDAVMFRVVPNQKTISFGYVDASVNEPIFEIL